MLGETERKVEHLSAFSYSLVKNKTIEVVNLFGKS